MGQLFDLWSKWLSGDQLGDARLWGWPVLAWGRLGKGIQFLAGLTVVLDLIGPERLRAFGSRLLDEPWRRLGEPAKRWALVFVGVFTVCWQLLFLLWIFARGFLSDLGISITWLSSVPAVIVTFVAMLALGYLSTPTLRKVWREIMAPQLRNGVVAVSTKEERKRLYSRLGDVNAPPSTEKIVQFSAALSYVLVFAVPLTLWMIISYGIFLPVVRGLAALLDRSQPAHPLRWTAFGLFLVGFHFDLLAS